MKDTKTANRIDIWSIGSVMLCGGALSVWAVRTDAAKANSPALTTPRVAKVNAQSQSSKPQPSQVTQKTRENVIDSVRKIAALEPKSQSQTVFERRIMPIFNSPNPSSCTSCHLAGVDLKDYILPSHQKTFISLRDQGLIDLDKPTDSKILRLIAMGAEQKADQKEGAALISNPMQKMEYEAFREWIVSSCREPELRRAPKLKPTELAQPAQPVEVIRHARKDHVLESFTKNVWSQQARCAGCHQPGSADNAKKVAEFGETMNWMRPEGPEATMRYLVEHDLINTQQPERSLLLLKPLNEIKHGGGQKMARGDLGYKAFRTWIEDYAKIVSNRYKSAADLPAPGVDADKDLQIFSTEIWFKINKTLPEWAGHLLQVTVYAWDKEANKWEDSPIAISDRMVFGDGNLWQHSLMLLARKGSARATAWTQDKATLSPGRYLVKVHVDREGRLQKDWAAVLGDGDYVGQTEIQSRWPQGYGQMTVIEGSQPRR